MSSTSAAGVIEIQTDKAARLFQSLDPLPFRERDLAAEAEDFIVGWARELPKVRPIKIVVHLPVAEVRSRAANMFANALHQYFLHRADSITNELKELFRIGRYSLLVGLVVLAACIAAGRLAVAAAGDGEFARVINEGLIILGWVANWRPIEIFLYEWWPLVRRRRLYRRLSVAEVDLHANEIPPISGTAKLDVSEQS